jgi:hypothetical protein
MAACPDGDFLLKSDQAGVAVGREPNRQPQMHFLITHVTMPP